MEKSDRKMLKANRTEREGEQKPQHLIGIISFNTRISVAFSLTHNVHIQSCLLLMNKPKNQTGNNQIGWGRRLKTTTKSVSIFDLI
jgi:hypothetical protein